MLEGTKDVAQLITQYSVIEATYGRVDSKLAQELRKLLESFYVDLLRYQVFAIKYFDPDKKLSRAVKGLNPVGAHDVEDKQKAIGQARDKVDRAIALVHVEVSKHSFDELKAGNEAIMTHQQQFEAAIREGILALSHNTGAFFKSQNVMLQQQFSKINDLWSDSFDKLVAENEKRELQRQKDTLNKIRKWISPAEPETNRADARSKRHMDLGNWLIEKQQLQNWKTSQGSNMLWLYGFAGTGKTGLVCRVIDYIQQSNIQSEESARLAFFFCSNDKAGSSHEGLFSRSEPLDVLRSLVSQLSTSMKNQTVAPIVLAKYNAFGRDSDQERLLSQSECKEILITISQEMPIMIILDAFDELNQNKSLELIQLFHEVMERSSRNVKIFMSTRPFPAIEKELDNSPALEVTAENNGGDVRTFIHKTLQVHIDNGDLLGGQVPTPLRADIERILSTRAQNMFLYASLLLTQLCNPNYTDDEESIRQKLEELPKNITDMYSGLLTEIHDDKNNSARSCQLAQDTFKWLLYAQEPLHWESLLHAISPPESAASLDEVLHVCKTLVVKDPSTFSLEFAHYTVREHISKMTKYSASKCHLTAAQSCLTVLNSCLGSERQQHTEPFVEYAILHWPVHYEGIAKEDLDDNRAAMNAMLRSFLLKGRSSIDKYTQWYNRAQEKAKNSQEHKYLATRLTHLRANPPSALFAACVFGHEEVIGKFGRELDGLNKHNFHGQTALCLAIENNKLEVVKALLTRRFPAELNLLNLQAVEQFEALDPEALPEIILYASAMQCAAAVGNVEIANFLIDQGANIDLVAGYYGSPLQAAAHNGHPEVTALLLRRGAEPNSQGGFYGKYASFLAKLLYFLLICSDLLTCLMTGNALQAAAAKGHYEIVTLLLENKPPALIGTPGGHHGSALMAAVSSGSSDTVWALLEERANPNSKTKNRPSLLEVAAKMGQSHADIVSLLLISGAGEERDFSSKDKGVHILHLAALHGMIDLAKRCLDEKCQIDMITTEGPKYPRRFGDFPAEMTPLGFACAEGHVEMVDFLIGRGAPFEVDKPRSALLWTAAYQGHAAVTDLLIRRFKAKNTPEQLKKFFNQRPDPRSGHPLMFAAASSGSPDVVRVLIEHGVEYQSNWFGATPLFATATFGAPAVTRLLIEYHEKGRIDALVNRQAGNGKTALIEAFSGNRWRVANILLQSTVDLTLSDKGGATALHWSTNFDNESLAAALVRKASEVLDRERFLNFINFRHSSGKTALLDCADRNRLDTLKLLLESGADFTIPGNAGNTPLHWASRHGYGHIMQPLVQSAQKLFSDDNDRYNAFLNYRNKDGVTPLMETVYYNHPSTLELFLDKGADYSIPRFNKTTVFHIAATEGYADITSSLLAKGSRDPNQERFQQAIDAGNDRGNTALMCAAELGRPGILKMLLDHGAGWALTNNNKYNALHFCVFRNRVQCVEDLLRHASSDPDSSKFRRLLNQQGANRATPIRDAAINGNTHLVKRLLLHDPDLELVDNGLRHILHHAVGQQNEDMFAVIMDFLKKKGDQGLVRRMVYAKEDRGDTVFEGVKRRNLPRMRQLLKDWGINV